VSLSPFRIYNDEITVLRSMAVLNSFGVAADLMAAGSIDTSPLLGMPFTLGQFPQALASVRNGEDIKVQVTLARIRQAWTHRRDPNHTRTRARRRDAIKGSC
jgi:hypothetical protein